MQDEVAVEDVCKQIIKQWTDYSSQSKAKNDSDDGIQLLITFLQYPFSLARYAIARWKELFEVTRMELLYSVATVSETSKRIGRTVIRWLKSRINRQRQLATEACTILRKEKKKLRIVKLFILCFGAECVTVLSWGVISWKSKAKQFLKLQKVFFLWYEKKNVCTSKCCFFRSFHFYH